MTQPAIPRGFVNLYPHATWVQANEKNVGDPLRWDKVRLFVIHVAQSPDQSGIDAWFKNPAAQVSAHFSVAPNGAVHQYVNLVTQAWAEADYNDVAISIEHVGYSGDKITAFALASSLHLLNWLHGEFPHVPLRRTANPKGTGVIGHGELGVAGGDHPDCPGTPILGQFDAALRGPLPR
jgi:N-acetyl-anhydromuramyl-L-alanine amidase AmpD